ncbi:MAG: hypothetical protein M3014_00925 [Chloroflexota bacterium]|nr:hypothetical protein [Chloroflexota bacterium]
MRKFITIMFSVVALVALSLGSAAAQGQSMTIKLNELHGSGDFGTATLTDLGSNQVRVVIQMGGSMPMEHNHPVHIHKGTCAALDPTPAFPLNAVTNGKSDTTVPVSLAALMAGSYAINLHESPSAITTYTACGEITTLNVVGTTSTGASNGSVGNAGGAGGAMAGMAGGSTSGGASAMPPTGNGGDLFLGNWMLMTALILAGVGLLLVRVCPAQLSSTSADTSADSRR